MEYPELNQVANITENISEGRIVINTMENAHLGLVSKNSKLKEYYVYNLFINAFGQCRIEELGRSSFHSERWELGSLLLTQTDKLIVTEKEKETNLMKSSEVGRMVLLSNGIIILRISKNNSFFETETVYEISTNEYLGTSIVKKGKTSVFQDNPTVSISTLILMEKAKFIMSNREKNYYSEYLNSQEKQKV